MIKSKSFGSRAADICIWSVILILTAACLFPLINMVAISFSNKSAAAGNLVGLVPVDFTLSSYKTLLKESQFWYVIFRWNGTTIYNNKEFASIG